MESPTRLQLLFRVLTTGFALALAVGVNAAAAYAMSGSGTPAPAEAQWMAAHQQQIVTLPAITVRACRVNV